MGAPNQRRSEPAPGYAACAFSSVASAAPVFYPVKFHDGRNCLILPGTIWYCSYRYNFCSYEALYHVHVHAKLQIQRYSPIGAEREPALPYIVQRTQVTLGPEFVTVFFLWLCYELFGQPQNYNVQSQKLRLSRDIVQCRCKRLVEKQRSPVYVYSTVLVRLRL